LLLTSLLLTLAPTSTPQSHAQASSRYFPETGKTTRARFLEYWNANGGLPRQGYPISEEIREVSGIDGKTYTVQYFERAVFELHPENAAPNDVLLSLLGVTLYREKYPNGAAGQSSSGDPGALSFPETGKRVGGDFLAYWQTNGGLPQFGYPLSDEFSERSDLDSNTYTVQYFERAVFERHPQNIEPYRVLLSQLGTFRYRTTYGANSPVGRVVGGPDMAIARSCHTATLLRNGKVLVAGGMIREGNFSTNAELYDPATGAFSPTGSLNLGRACHSATLLPDGKVLIVSGDYNHDLDSAELYDPSTGRFTLTGNLNHARDGATATLLPNGKVLVAGGHDNGLLRSAELYNPSTGTFSPTGDMSIGRSISAASLLPDGRVLITGGGTRGIVRASAELYDPSTGTFSPTGDMALPRYKHAQATLPDGRVLIVGGSDDRDWQGRHASAELYDPATGRFTPTGSMQEARFKLIDAVALTRQGTLLVSGGGSLVELYDPRSGRFATATGNTGTARYTQTATLLPNGSVLIAGGYDTGIASTAHTWLYEP
jgi:WD40 repeat protein